jgi:hypothetical protein
MTIREDGLYSTVKKLWKMALAPPLEVHTIAQIRP